MIGATQALLDLLAQHPDGLTSQQAAHAMRAACPETVSSRLSKLFAYGEIGRLKQRNRPTIYLRLKST